MKAKDILNRRNMSKVKTLPEILEKLIDLCGGNIWWSYQTKEKNPAINEAQEAIAKELMGCLPEKRELFEPVTKRPVTGVGDIVAIDLEADTKGSLKFIQDNGYNQALDEVRARLTAFIGKDSNENS